MNEMNFKVLPNIMLALQFTLVKRKGKTKMYSTYTCCICWKEFSVNERSIYDEMSWRF